MAEEGGPVTVLPTDIGGALRGLVDRAYLVSQQWQEQQWRADFIGAEPLLFLWQKAFIQRLGKVGVPAFAHNCVRSSAHQEALFVQGVSKARGGKSPHNFGLAVDIVHSRKLWAMSALEWRIFEHIGKELALQMGVDLVWGGDWSDPDGDGIGWDPAHWERANWKQHKGDFPWQETKTTLQRRALTLAVLSSARRSWTKSP